jgi:ubiquinone biosynthesis protein
VSTYFINVFIIRHLEVTNWTNQKKQHFFKHPRPTSHKRDVRMTLYDLLKNHQHRKRLKEILFVFSEEGFGLAISKVKLKKHLPLTKRLRLRSDIEKKFPPEVRLRRAFEKLGPTFIKFGQLLSLRPDLIPKKYVQEFEKMQDKVPSFSFTEARKIIETELGKQISKIFTTFPPKPVASASIAQVYKAKLGKKDVAVKVQRPNVNNIIKTDIEIMYKIAELLESHIPELSNYHLRGIIHEFERWTIKELNFKVEAHYAQKMGQNNKDRKTIKIPEIYSKLTTEKILVMEFIEGIPLHNIKELKKNKIKLDQVFKDGFDTFIKHFFVDGLFHGDPHPGNILILKDGRIGLVDFGIVGHLDKKLKNQTTDILRAILNNDYQAASKAVLKMSSTARVDKNAFEQDMEEIFEQMDYSSTEDIKLGQLLNDLISLINKHHLKVPLEFVIFEKGLITVEGLALKYRPNFNMVKETKESFKKIFDSKYLVKQALTQASDKVSEYKELVGGFPETAAEILDSAKKFKLSIDIEDADIKGLTSEIEKSSGNMALGIIIAAIIMASALLVQAKTSPYFYISGFVLAAIFGIWLIKRTIFFKIK